MEDGNKVYSYYIFVWKLETAFHNGYFL